jgi:Flp pilus assembly pilin Flp
LRPVSKGDQESWEGCLEEEFEEVGTVIEATILARAALYRLQAVRELRGQGAQRGQGMSEYALILVLVALAVILALTAVGKQIAAVFEKIKTALNVA